MLDVEEMATWAGYIMAIIVLIAFFVKPVLSSFTKITENLT